MSSSSRVTADDGKAMTGRFVVERCLGEGSMGAVYLAYDRARASKVALKTLRRVDASGIYRFKREFRALADVSHPNLVELHELFSEGSDWFFTMEYVEGQDFLTYLLGSARRTSDIGARRRTREQRALRDTRAAGMEVLFASPLADASRLRDVLRQVVQAVMALHAVGKLHRDLKPDNVMVTAEGRAVVLDFGIAAERHRDTHGTMEAGVMGTPAYMSPEQAAGTAITEATDWYALGAMIYEALTGQVPFDGSYTEVLNDKQQADPPRPSQLVSGVSNELDALCMRLLSRNPDQRPSGAEILDALGSAPSNPPPRAPDSRGPFVGRAHELGELERSLAATDEGSPVLVFVHGATGMGKSALVERFLDGVDKSATVALSGRCYEHEMVPFKALDSVIDSLSRYLGRLAPIEAAEVLPKDIHALAQLFPVLTRVSVLRGARRRGGMAKDPRTLHQQATLALKELLSRVAMRQRLCVFIDDLQWGDVDSARVLAQLMTGGRDRPPLLLLCTYRSADAEPSPCLSTLLELLRGSDQASVREISVGALPERECVQLAEQLLGNDSEAAAVARESRGNPYLLTQLVEHVRGDRGPSSELKSGIRVSLEHALSERLGALSADANKLLELVSVSGRPLREQLVTQLAERDINLPGALTELRRAKLVRGVGAEGTRAIGIYHETIRDAVLSRMDLAVIREWHRRLATAIERSEPVEVAALIDHLLGSEDYARAGFYAIGAARQALAALAFDKAAELFEIAVRHHADDAWRQELRVQLAEALVSAGRSTRAAEVYLEAAERTGDREAASLRLKAGTQLVAAGRIQRGAQVLAPVLDELGLRFPRDDDDALQTVATLLPRLQKRGFEFTARSEREIDGDTLARLDACWSLVQATFATQPIIGQVIVLHYLLRALEVGETRRIIVGLCAYFVSIDLGYSTMDGSKPKALHEAEALCREIEDPRCRAWVAFAHGFAFQHDGLLKPATLDFARAEELFHKHCSNVASELRAVRLLHARTMGIMGQLDDMGVCEQWIRDALQCEDVISATRLRLIIVPRLLLGGDVEQAQEALRIPPELGEEGAGLTHLTWLIAGAMLAHYNGASAELEKLATEMSAVGRSPLLAIRVWRSDFMIARTRALLGASRSAEDRADVIARADKALASLENLALECHADHVRLLRAAVHAQRGETERACTTLDAILRDADMGGDGPLILACARLRKGQIVGGQAGAALVRDGIQELSLRGAQDPVRFARLYAPGFEDPYLDADPDPAGRHTGGPGFTREPARDL